MMVPAIPSEPKKIKNKVGNAYTPCQKHNILGMHVIEVKGTSHLLFS